MKFMLMMNAPSGDGSWGVVNWAPQDFKAMVDFMKNFDKRLKEEVGVKPTTNEWIDAWSLK